MMKISGGEWAASVACVLWRTCPSEGEEAVSFKLWQCAVILYQGAWQGAEAGERGVRNAGSWHCLTVIPGVVPSETSRCRKVEKKRKKSTRKLLSQGKSVSASKRSGLNSIVLLLICLAFTPKELRYYPEPPSYILQGDFVSVSLPLY